MDRLISCEFNMDNACVELKFANGSMIAINTIAVENGEVRVAAADCPDQTCVKMGALRSRALPIVCLPHHLTIRFVDGAEDGGLDAVAR